MNESFQRITAWAKAHPAASIGIVAALIVVGYLVYKNTAAGGSLTASGDSGDSSGVTSGGGGESAVPVSPTEPVYTYPGALPPAVNYAIPDYSNNPSPTAAPVLTNLAYDPGGNLPSSPSHESVIMQYQSIPAAHVVAQAAAVEKSGGGSVFVKAVTIPFISYNNMPPIVLKNITVPYANIPVVAKSASPVIKPTLKQVQAI